MAFGGGLCADEIKIAASRFKGQKVQSEVQVEDESKPRYEEAARPSAPEFQPSKRASIVTRAKTPSPRETTQQPRNGARRHARQTFGNAPSNLIASNEADWMNAKHRQQWRNTLATYAYPILGDVPVADVNTDLVLKMVEPIWATKTETASRVRGRIERVLSSAKARQLRDGETLAV